MKVFKLKVFNKYYENDKNFREFFDFLKYKVIPENYSY